MRARRSAAHPHTWSEIGFPGPAYPHWYKNPGVDAREPFEVRDTAPADDPARGGSLMARVRGRNESPWLLPNDSTTTNRGLRFRMRNFADTDEVDLAVVGRGAGGSTLLQRLARQGWRMAGLEAGPLYAAFIGWSRIWLGVHWPTDVVGGFLSGVAWTCGIMAALPARGWRPWPAACRRRTDGHSRRA